MTDAAPSARDEGPVRRPPEDRGKLRIDHTVVRKIAQYAADRVPGTTTVAKKVAGLGLGEQGSAVRVGGDGNDVDLHIELALHYPAPVREVVEDVRARVTEDVRRLTSYQVRSVDVTISALLPDIPPRVR
ncbi:putative alkaline shock family protein YloU [Herbihabitans rhizosphaerae]|uniref:Putative alkaline shock family protein YloU n=1 Tax=Herbihabitans rhizosphaerae TaxID=1872711 RepID=A0A4Q7L3B6_9PSEU|nr:Asp23/Gls24 family envelope stress response protein [Herbihabitans rhizosphaerae]RZS43636.1 putative alkaline shock family protein YloU [Herbihabitans rhizosphaerae]